MPDKLLIIGISGVTCGGKTTTATALHEMLPKSHLISQDNYFLGVDDPRHVWIKELNHINFDILSSLDMEKMHDDIQEFIQDKTTSTDNFNHKEMQNTPSNGELKESDFQVLIVEGFLIFNYKPLIPLFHLKYYFTLSEEECFKRRSQRVYEPPDCPGYFEKCAWPEYVKQLQEVQTEVQGVKYFDGQDDNALEQILADIEHYRSNQVIDI